MSDLKSKTLKGLFWSLADSFGAYFLRFGFSIAIARALSPADYGLMGMIVIFIAISSILIESGFGMALIQKKNATSDDYSTVFFFNLFVAISIYTILFFSAQSIANFYNQQILVNVIRVSALSIVFGALGTIQVAILSKELNFKKQTFISLFSVIVSGTTGVIIAYNGYQVWALVFQTMAGSLIRLILLWLVSNWRPSFIFSWKSFKGLYKYGFKIFLQGASDVVFSKIYFPLIGKYFSPSQLGYYTNANNFSAIIVKQTTVAYGRVLFPAMSLIGNDKEKISNAYSTIFRLISIIIFPISIIAIVSAHSFVDFFLTVKWLPAVPFMQLFLVEGFFFALYMLNQNTFNAIGRSGLSLQVDIIKKALLFICLLVTFNYGINALIIGQIVSSFLVFVYSLFIVVVKLKIKILYLLIDLIKLSIIAILIALFNYYVIQNFVYGSSIVLLSQIIILSILYVVLVYLLKVKGLKDVTEVFAKYIPAKLERIISNRFV